MKQKKTGIVVPCAGQLHQEYISRFYQKLSPLPKVMISFWNEPDGWMAGRDDVKLLSSSNPVWRCANKICRQARLIFTADAKRRKYAPMAPMGWRKRFRDHVRENRIDRLVIIYGGCAVSLLPELKKLDIPIAVVVCGSDAQMGDEYPWYGQKLRQVWEIADQCVFVSNFLKKQSLDRGCPEEKSRVIYWGTPMPQNFNIHKAEPSEDLEWITVANFLPVKGIEYLIKAFDIVHKKYSHAKLSLIGSGPLEERLKQLACERGLGSSIEFLGRVSNDVVQKELARRQVYIQPSIRSEDGREEGLPQAVLEAQGLGLPAIVTRTGGLPEIVEDGQTGYIVPQKDVESMADAMLKLVEDAELRRKMSAAAYARIKSTFNIDVQINLWKDMIRELTDQAG